MERHGRSRQCFHCRWRAAEGAPRPTRSDKAKAKKATREGAARLAWWDAEYARLKPALDAYELQRPAAQEAAKESEEIWERVDDVTAEISISPTVTLAGAMALLGEAVRQVNVKSQATMR